MNTRELSMKSSMQVVNHLYIDLECLQDFRIGAARCMITNFKEYEYIFNKLDEYDSALDYSIEKNFPVLKITDDAITRFLNTEENSPKLSVMSPMTSLFEALPEFLRPLVENKKRIETKQISVTINTYPIDYAPASKQKLNTYLLECGVEGEPVYICRRISTLPKEFFISRDLFIIYDIEDFLREDSSTVELFCTEGLFVPKKIFALARLNQEFIKENGFKDEPKVLIENVEKALNFSTDFTFCMRSILKPGEHNVKR